MTELQRRGLNDEESFWLARKRVGKPQQIGEEFEKADPSKVWGERIFWAAIAFLIIELWATISNVCSTFALYSPTPRQFNQQLQDVLPAWVSFYLPLWIGRFSWNVTVNILVRLANMALVLALASFLIRGKMKSSGRIGQFLFASRMRFVVYTMAFGLCLSVLNALVVTRVGFTFSSGVLLASIAYQFLGFSIPVSIIVWLLPTTSRKAAKQT